MAKMGTDELKAIVEAKLNNSLGWLGGSLSKARIQAQSYYRGDLFGNEQEGRSKVVSRDVAEAIDSAMPSLVKMFVTTETIVVFSPRRPEDEEAAKQATDYVNWVWQTLPNSFDLLQTWIKSGLLSQLGVVKSWWDDSEEVTTEDYKGLTKFQYLTLLSDDEVEVVKYTTKPPEMPTLDLQAMMPRPGQSAAGAPLGMGSSTTSPMLGGGMPGDDGSLYDCTIKRTKKRGRICVEAIPPEEFLTERRAVSLDPGYCSFAAHRSRRTVTDLIEMGYPRKKVESLPGSDDLDYNQEVVNRFRPEDNEPTRDNDSLDPSMRGVWVAESYLKVDFNDDGIAEWRKVMLAGGGGFEILDNDECDGHPFSAWTPYKSPHKLIGEGMSDKTGDLQLIKSTVWRQILDGMYFNNAPQLVVIEGQANMEDVVTRRPGGVIRTKSVNAVTPLPVQDSSASGFSMISYLDSVRETRTGIRRFTSGLEGDELNPYASTATGANIIEDASQDALLLIARNFAELGLKPLFKRILELTCKYQDKKQTVRLRGKWVDIDPSTWTTEMDMTVTVGLGSGNRDRQVGQLLQLMTQIDVPIVQLQGGVKGPLLTIQNVYNKVKKLTEAMGYKEADGLYTDPATAPPMPDEAEKPDPAMVKVQAGIQEAKARFKLDREKALAAHELKMKEVYAKLDLQAQSADRKSQQDGLLALQKMEREHQLRLIEMNDEQEARIAEMYLEAKLGAMEIKSKEKVQGAAQIRRAS